MEIGNKKTKATLICCFLFSATACYTCIRIEIFNDHAGGYLPRNLDVNGEISEWRVAAPSAVRAAMEEGYKRQAEFEGRVFVLNAQQEGAIQAAMQRAKEDADFRDFVGTYGLAQYLIAPLAMVMSLSLSTNSRLPKSIRIPFVALACASCVLVVVMLYRGYFSSLGW